MRKGPRDKKDRKPVCSDNEHCYEICIGRVAATQRAIELALVVDEDLHGMGVARYPKGNAYLMAIGVHRYTLSAFTARMNVDTF